MKKRRGFIGLLIVFLIVFIIIVQLAFLDHSLVLLIKNPSLWYYINSTHVKELPTKLIRPAVRLTTGLELPIKADNLRAIIRGGRDTMIFVRFDTDSEGIAYVQRTFTVEDVSYKPIDSELLKGMTEAGISLFIFASEAQEELGICIFDQESIESCLELKCIRFHILIDDQRDTVYMLAWGE